MRKWRCDYRSFVNEHLWTIGKIYESDDGGYGIKTDTGIIMDNFSACKPVGSTFGFKTTKFTEVFDEKEEVKMNKFKVGVNMTFFNNNGDVIAKAKTIKMINQPKTLTITTSDTTTTITDGTHTTSINRYYTDKHNERNAVSIVIDKYYDELVEIERVKKLPKVGDKVRVVNKERTFSCYDTWLIENNVELRYAVKWIKGATPINGNNYRIVAVHKHLSNKNILALIENEDGCYIINVEGLEVVK